MQKYQNKIFEFSSLNKNLLALRDIIFQVIFCVIILLNLVFVNDAQEIPLAKDEILEAEELLHKLGYWIESIDNKIDESTYYSVLAFQRVSGLKTTGKLTSLELKKIRKGVNISPKIKGYFHIEVDISKKILFFVYPDGTINHILPVATGTNKLFKQAGKTQRARTPRGTFIIKRKIEGWRQSSLGNMYYPNYIVGGIAIHGSKKIPNYPSTYGCIAIPLYAAEMLSLQAPIGTIVVIY